MVFRCERDDGLRFKWIQGCETRGDIERDKEWSERAAKFSEAATTSKGWEVEYSEWAKGMSSRAGIKEEGTVCEKLRGGERTH